MFTVDKFYEETRSLSNSLVIKINDIARVMETAYLMPLKLQDYSALKWRYYKHLKGEYYSTPAEYGYSPPYEDSPVYIKVIETEEQQVLTKELLEKYPVTKEELLKQGDYYLDLINNNTRMTVFIHGCLFPTNYTIEELIDLPDGTIIGYNTTLIEEQEYDLIPRLEQYVKDVLGRWHVNDYMIGDNLYLHSMLAVLYSYIPNKIINIRMDNIRTHRVHSFFMEAYFRSKFDLWDNIKILKKETITWLYLNLDYLAKHIGRNETFKKILDKVFGENNVGIGGYVLQPEDVKLIEENVYNPRKQPFSETIATVEKVGLNGKFLYENNDNVSISETLNKEFNLVNKYNQTQKNFLLKKYEKDINSGIRDLNKTKILEISTLKTFNGYNVDMFQVLFDYWTFLLGKNLYGSFTDDKVTTNKVDFTDPNNGTPYSINSRSGYYILLYVMMHAINGLDVELDEVSITTVLDPSADLDNILTKSLFQDGYTNFFHTFLKDNYPKAGRQYTSHLDVSTLLDKVIKYYKDVWLYISNSENCIVNANLREFLFMASYQDKIKIHNKNIKLTIKELLRNEGVDFSIEKNVEYDHLSTIKELYKVCLGITIDSLSELQDFLRNLKEIQRKLTSYTLQTFGDVSSENEHYIFYNTTTMFASQKGLIELKKDVLDMEALSDVYFQTRYLAVRPINDMAIWGNNCKQNSKLIETVMDIGRLDMYSDEIYTSIGSSATCDLIKYRNDIPQRVYPNHEQIMLYLKEIKIVDGDIEYVTKFNRHYAVDSTGSISSSNESNIIPGDNPKGYVRGTGRISFDDDATPHDTTYFDK